jgi:hypothetical protein
MIGQQMDLNSMGRGQAAMQRIFDAAIEMNARQEAERRLADNRAYAETMQGRQFEQAKAMQLLQSRSARSNAEAQVGLQDAAYRRRETERAVRELVMKGYSPTAEERKAIDAGDPTPFLQRATNEQIESAGANLERFDADIAALEKADEQNANDFKANRDAWVKKKTSETFMSQFQPDQIKEIEKRMSAKRGYPVTFEKAAEAYAAEKEIEGFLPVSQIEAVASEEFDTMKDNPITKAHGAKARQIAIALQRNANERSDFLQISPHAQQALIRRRGKKPALDMISDIDSETDDSLNADLGYDTAAPKAAAIAPQDQPDFVVPPPNDSEIATARKRAGLRKRVYSIPTNQVQEILSGGGKPWVLGDEEYARQALLIKALENPEILDVRPGASDFERRVAALMLQGGPVVDIPVAPTPTASEWERRGTSLSFAPMPADALPTPALRVRQPGQWLRPTREEMFAPYGDVYRAGYGGTINRPDPNSVLGPQAGY